MRHRSFSHSDSVNDQQTSKTYISQKDRRERQQLCTMGVITLLHNDGNKKFNEQVPEDVTTYRHIVQE